MEMQKKNKQKKTVLSAHQAAACRLSSCFAVRRLQSKGILIQIFPLHEQEALKRLSFSWYRRVKLSLQPLGT